MLDLIRAFKRIPERNRTIAYGIMSLLINLFIFAFKIAVGIVYNAPLLIVLAIFNLLIGVVKANCSRGLLKNRDEYKDCRTYIIGGSVLFVSSLLFVVYLANEVYNPYSRHFSLFVAILIAFFATVKVGVSIDGLVKIKGRTLLIKEYRLTNFAMALTNVILTQIAILSFLNIDNMYYYNSVIGFIVGGIVLIIGLYLIVSGFIYVKVYTTGITNKRKKNDKK